MRTYFNRPELIKADYMDPSRLALVERFNAFFLLLNSGSLLCYQVLVR